MYSVFEIVNWLRVRNNADMKQDPNIEELSQMKTMKLLYYIQAASLSVTGKRLFNNDIVAWKYGPVVEAVHDKYKGQRGIVNSRFPITQSDLADYQKLEADPEAADILNSVYEAYGYSSAYDLMRQTHREKPWQETPQSQVISDESIRQYYRGVFYKDDQK